MILLVHRYTAVAVGVLMTLWCLSGFVMMYQAYPELTEEERRQGLEPLDLAPCCAAARLGETETDDAPLPSFRVEMHAGEPVLKLGQGRQRGAGADSGGAGLGLRTGHRVGTLSLEGVTEVARRYASGHGVENADTSVTLLDIDQWTVQTARRNQPAYHVVFGDRAGSEIYVSGTSGEVFQDTTRRERVLTWLGAIPHWLYPLQLRQNGPLWTQIVIWTSVVGTFLAATGLYVGISRYMRARSRGRASLFRGWWYWHHIGGLVFGVLALTWVFSGLMTMNPWGVLQGRGGADFGRQISAGGTWGELRQFLGAAAEKLPSGEFSQLRSVPFDGRLYVLAERADGTGVRLDAGAEPAPLEQAAIETAVDAAVEAHGERVASFEILTREDSYYYGHKRTADLPVYRVILDDAEGTRLYVDRETGSVRTVGPTSRLSRWIRTGLHDMDFAWIRARPVWDLTVITLLAGVTLVCFTGTWMALKRIRLDWRRGRRKLRRRNRLPARAG